ncbi:hypothetical protein SAMN05421847_0156 [Halpernia humi]|uniref:Uncharacterized protein n=1 Tax=Halpernia humi TaxID=493375 RepID=A0A1H5SIG2_9FLAO|nr:hypothetical protein SAMN05421847_0156 [Halpernia humi]
MKLKILKVEIVIQILILIACSIWYAINFNHNPFFILLYILLILAFSNFIGFLVRVFTVKSNWMKYYFFIIIFYLASLYILGAIFDVENYFFKFYLIVFSLLISLYYTFSGFYIIKELKLSSNSKK